MNDQQILAKLRSGDYGAFKHLYQHYGKIEHYVVSNNGSVDDARDLFQNALIVFYKNVQKEDFNLSSQISTYLYSIVKNLWLKKLTRSKEVTGLDKIESHEQVAKETSEIELDATHSEDQDPSIGGYLQDLLQKVGDPCKSLITFFHFDQLSWDEIAERLNYKTAHAARNQKYKCFLKIRKLIPESDRNRLFNALN